MDLRTEEPQTRKAYNVPFDDKGAQGGRSSGNSARADCKVKDTAGFCGTLKFTSAIAGEFAAEHGHAGRSARPHSVAGAPLAAFEVPATSRTVPVAFGIPALAWPRPFAFPGPGPSLRLAALAAAAAPPGPGQQAPGALE
jgi:hypothetical protein